MTTALNDVKNVMKAFSGLCDAYVFKPFDKTKLLAELRKLGLIP
jgi:DNA-binding response OmpR family regulator